MFGLALQFSKPVIVARFRKFSTAFGNNDAWQPSRDNPIAVQIAVARR